MKLFLACLHHLEDGSRIFCRNVCMTHCHKLINSARARARACVCVCVCVLIFSGHILLNRSGDDALHVPYLGSDSPCKIFVKYLG
jgi:hypothetical protein